MSSYRTVALLVLLSLPGQQPQDDGFYSLAASGIAVRSLAGEEIHLGRKLNERVVRAAVRSVSNSNDSYSLQLETKNELPREVALCVKRTCVTFNSWGGGAIGTFRVGAQIPSRALAEL